MEQQPSARSWIPLFIAVCLVAINMRMSITGVGPLLDDIAADQGVSPAALGMLASMPLFAWALVSPLAQGLAARIGLNAAVSWSLVALLIATVVRSLPGSQVNLWVGTALIGAALAVTNVLLPAAVKRDFGSRVPLVMGIYSGLLGLAAAIGAGMVAPIAYAETAPGEPLGWRVALLATGATIPIALVVWIRVHRRATPPGSMSRRPSQASDAESGSIPQLGRSRSTWVPSQSSSTLSPSGSRRSMSPTAPTQLPLART